MMISEASSPNERPPVDAGTALGFAFASHWSGTTKAGCYPAMRSILRHASLLLALVISAAALRAAAQPTTRRWTINGVTREAMVYVPESATTQPSPVIFAFHGRGGKMQGAAKLAFENAWPEAIVVYPQALKTPGLVADLKGKQFAWQSKPGMADDRDLKFFDAMLDSVEKDYRVDPDRIYATGHSNGGQFTYLLWQTRGDKIAAFAPAAAALAPVILNPDANDVTVAVKTPRPILIIAGQADSDHFDWQERSIGIVRRINHCGDGEPWDGTTHRTLYPSPDGAPVIAYIHPGGHALPPDASAVIIKFFKQFPKPAAHSAQ
jgi:polyhydroxybutyrate depolymerase